MVLWSADVAPDASPDPQVLHNPGIPRSGCRRCSNLWAGGTACHLNHPRTAPRRSRSSRVSRRSASAPACTSVRRALPGCTTWSTRSSTTPSTRPWPVMPPRSTWCCCPTGAARSPTTGAASRSSRPSSTPTRAPRRSCSRSCTPAASSGAAATRCPAASTASACRSSTRCPPGSRWRSTATASVTACPSRTAASSSIASGRRRLAAARAAPRTGDGRFWPTRDLHEVTFQPRRDRRFQVMAFLNGAAHLLQDLRPDNAEAAAADRVLLRRRHRDFVRHVNARRRRCSPGGLLPPGGGGRRPGDGGRVAFGGTGTTRRPALVRERHQHDRGRHARARGSRPRSPAR